MAIPIINTPQTVNTSKARTSSLKEPNWDYVPHKGMNAPTKEEIFSKLKELMEQLNAASPTDDVLELESSIEKLKSQYISKASPNRKLLWKSAQAFLKKVNISQNTDFKHNSPKTLVDYLVTNNSEHGKKELKNGAYYPIDGGSIRPIANSLGTYDFDIYSGGEVVFHIDSTAGIVFLSLTRDELKLQEEFNSYRNSIRHALDRKSNSQSTTSSFGMQGFDVRG